MILEENEKIHVATRRMLAEETRRHFAGRIQSIEGGLVRVEGYAFVLNPARNEWTRRPELRTRVISLSDAGNIINVLPPSVDIGSLEYRIIDGRLFVTDAKAFRLDVNEFGPRR